MCKVQQTVITTQHFIPLLANNSITNIILNPIYTSPPKKKVLFSHIIFLQRAWNKDNSLIYNKTAYVQSKICTQALNVFTNIRDWWHFEYLTPFL